MGCAWMRCGCAGRRLRPSRLRLRWTLSTNSSFPKKYPLATKYGLHPQLAQLEMLVNPNGRDSAGRRCDGQRPNARNHSAGAAADALCVEQQPRHSVRLTEFSIHEETFDPNLNPIRAKLSLGMRVLSVDDLGFEHPGGRMFMSYLTNKEYAGIVRSEVGGADYLGIRELA